MALMKLSSEQIKEEMSGGEGTVLSVNIGYPGFEGENGSVTKKLNEFYFGAADSFFSFCKKKYAPRLVRKAAGGENVPKNGAVMSWYVSFLNKSILSMITDVSFFDGREKKSERIIHNWDLRDGTPMRAKDAFFRSRALKKLYSDEIASKIRNREGNFGYYENAEKIAADRFDFEKFYFTPKGIAFYYDKNTLFRSDSVYPAYVIPFSEMSGITEFYRN